MRSKEELEKILQEIYDTNAQMKKEHKYLNIGQVGAVIHVTQCLQFVLGKTDKLAALEILRTESKRKRL